MARRRLDVLFRRQDLSPGAVAGRACAVIDVLRAGTSAACAVAAGAREIRLFDRLDEAREARPGFGDDAVLAGERGGLRPEGFDLGNSPAEFAPEAVSGRTLLFTTTNGTAALAGCAGAEFVAFAGLVNARAVARAIAPRPEDVLLVCSGTEGRCAAEDVLCAGLLARSVADAAAGGLELADGARVAVDFAERRGDDPLGVLTSGEHGRRLAAMGLSEDLAACARIDSVEAVPVLRRDPLRLVRA